MKKLIAAVLVAAMVLTMSGCSAVFDAMKSGVSEIADGYSGEFKAKLPRRRSLRQTERKSPPWC